MTTKQNFKHSSKYLAISTLIMLIIVSIFTLAHYFQVNMLAESKELVLVRMGSIMIYMPSETLISVYVWDIFWLVISLLYSSSLRLWISSSWLIIFLAGYLLSVVISPLVSYEMSIYMIAYFKTSCIYSLLVLQQKIAKRDINDRGYEVHQSQFNIIYRRVLHAGK